MAALPQRLRQRGFKARDWNRLTPAQQRDVIRQSDALYKKTRGEAHANAPRSSSYKRRVVFGASGFSDVPSRLRHTAKFSGTWYRVYSDPDNAQLDDVRYLNDTLYDYAKREDTEEAWQAFKEYYQNWIFSI
jgi:hypothetical protein